MKIDNLEEHNKKIIENLMEKTLTAMCNKVNLSFPDWDVSEELYLAMKQSKNFNELKDLSEQYDGLYSMAEAFKVRNLIAPKYSWLKNLFKND